MFIIEEDGLELQVKRIKRENKTPSPFSLAQKSPISVLNELRSGLKYNVDQQRGPSHAPVFTVCFYN